MKNSIKKITALILCLIMLVSTLAGCGSEKTGVISNGSKSAESSNGELEKELTPEEKAAQKAFENSTAENDTDVGLKNIKIDTAERNLTDGQKAVLEFFDDDYLTVPSYEFLRRYPNVFDGAQVELWGTVKKVVSMDADTYNVVRWLGIGHAEYD